MSETGKTTDSKFPVFRAGDSLGKVASHEHQNRIGQSIERLSQQVFGVGDASLNTGPLIFKKPRRRGAGGGGATIRFEIIDWLPGDPLTSPCEAVYAEAIQVPCRTSSVAVGDIVIIWDPALCFFDLPTDMLIGSKGTATEMSASGMVINEFCVESPDENSCVWIVQTLCCAEEVYA